MILVSVPLFQQPRKESTKLPAILILKSITKRDALILSVKRITSRVVIHHLRAFYLQPSPDSKITSDARHLLVSFEINPTTRNGRTAFVPTRWRLYTLHDLKVQVKHEFNASNLNLYDEAYLLAEDRTEV